MTDLFKIEEVRAEVIAFALLMEKKLRKKDHKGGWGHRPLSDLWHSVHQEMKEFDEAIVNQHGADHVLDEAVDVANYMMMVVDRMGGLKNGKNPGIAVLEQHKKVDSDRYPKIPISGGAYVQCDGVCPYPPGDV